MDYYIILCALLISIDCEPRFAGGVFDILSKAQIYDPSAGAWELAAEMPMPRAQAASCVLGDGRVALS